MYLHDSELQHCRNVESGWFSSNDVALACTDTFQCSKSLDSTPFRKLVVFVSESLSLKPPLTKRYFVNSSIFSSILTKDLAFLAQLYTSYINFLSLRQKVVSETSSNTCKGKQAKLTLDLHSLIPIGTRRRVQRHNKTKLEHTKQHFIIYRQPNLFVCHPSFPASRIKKGKTTFNLVMSVHPHYFIKAFFCS